MEELAGNGKRRDVDRLLLGIEDVQRALGVKRSTVFSLLQRGDLVSTRIGRRRLVPVAALERFVKNLEAEAERDDGQSA